MANRAGLFHCKTTVAPQPRCNYWDRLNTFDYSIMFATNNRESGKCTSQKQCSLLELFTLYCYWSCIRLKKLTLAASILIEVQQIWRMLIWLLTNMWSTYKQKLHKCIDKNWTRDTSFRTIKFVAVHTHDMETTGYYYMQLLYI